MAPRKIFNCVVDDTALTTNISELKKWVSQGSISLVIPVYKRLHILQRDGSQIGINAREAVKFLDRITSGQDTIPLGRVSIQEPDQQFGDWPQVEQHLPEQHDMGSPAPAESAGASEILPHMTEEKQVQPQDQPRSTSALSQMLLNKLNFAKAPETTSPKSSPPTTPVSSNPQSSKTSPEVPLSSLDTPAKDKENTASRSKQSDKIAVPDAIKPLVSFVVWLFNEKRDKAQSLTEYLFLTNNGDKAKVVRSFGVPVKNIHQLRSAILAEDQEIKNQTRYRQKNSASPPEARDLNGLNAKTLFKYEEESEDEEVVFKPRSRPNSGVTSRAVKSHDSLRDKQTNRKGRPASTGFSPNTKAAIGFEKSADVPVLEIDPDSFDRGSSGRPSQPIFNPAGGQISSTRPPSRGAFNPAGNSFASPRGNGFARGMNRGFDRGSFRGRGRLFNG